MEVTLLYVSRRKLIMYCGFCSGPLPFERRTARRRTTGSIVVSVHRTLHDTEFVQLSKKRVVRIRPAEGLDLHVDTCWDDHGAVL